MKQEGYHQLVGTTGYLLLKVPQEILGEIKTSVDEIQKDFTKATPYNSKLAGQIDKEYKTQLTNKTSHYIRWAVGQYIENNPRYVERAMEVFPEKPILDFNGKGWINFQTKHEYNPIHHHSGVLSFVIWYQIPFYKENEIKYGAGKGKLPEHNLNGELYFSVYDGEGVSTSPLGIDKTMEGCIAIFPSNLHHGVYPFYTSDDYRITVSGNIYLKSL